MIRELRDQILRLKGFDVASTASIDDVAGLFKEKYYALVLIDVDAESKVHQAEQLCASIKEVSPDQPIAYVCNHRVAIHSGCPDEVIRSEFNPEALVAGVQQMIH